MRLSKTIVAILLCAATLTLPAATTAANPTQKPRAKAQTPAPQTAITRENVEAIVSGLEAAMKKKDLAVITAYLAPDMTYKSQTANRSAIELNRAQFLEVMKLSLELTLDYVYLRKSLTVNVAPGGQSATAQTETFEMVTTAQGAVAGHSVGVITFKIYKGKVLISSMESTNTPV
jgi:malonyl CoA-acyl carrier protein transacylase